jgi:AcrR family transcriptional regulator
MTTKRYHHGDLKNALIDAGIKILSEEGIGALSLRKVALRAGVSHAAPYAHFTDKQALIAAISTEGYRKLCERLEATFRRYEDDPLRQLIESAWAYTSFALEDPAHFKITFSSAVEKEKDYPALVAMSKKSFALVEDVVRACQAAGILSPGPTDAVTVSVWSLVHGFVSLQLESQISHTITERMSVRQLLVFCLNAMTREAIPRDYVDIPQEPA